MPAGRSTRRSSKRGGVPLGNETQNATPAAVRLSYFSDVLCIWAYTAQIKLEEVRRHFGTAVDIEYRFLRVFGDAHSRIEAGWAERGGFEGYADFVRSVAADFDYVALHPEVWRTARPSGSEPCHLYCKAVQLLEREGRIDTGVDPASGRTRFEEFVWSCRQAFFAQGRDLSRFSTLRELVEACGLPLAEVEACIADGRAFAARARDEDLKERFAIEGSPTFLLNEGRQRLYGNVGYRILEANIQELIERPRREGASWC